MNSGISILIISSDRLKIPVTPMKVSVCITILNEENSVSRLLQSLLDQSQKPDEVVIVDGGSSDKTVAIIRHFQKKDKRIKLLIEKCSRARGRNLAVEVSKNQIIAMTDAGCVPEKKWLQAITKPFKIKEVDVVAGFYKMKALNSLQRAFSVFLGTNPRDFDIHFLPSARSIAFRKSVWEKVGGFPEDLKGTAEDMVFNFRAKDIGARYAFVKEAEVEWEMPKSLLKGIGRMYSYARGDAQSKIFYHFSKGLASHNIKVLTIFARYIFGLMILILSLKYSKFFIPLIFLFFYIIWAFRKVFVLTNSPRAGFWGVLIQILSDFAVMAGFVAGLVSREK